MVTRIITQKNALALLFREELFNFINCGKFNLLLIVSAQQRAKQ